MANLLIILFFQCRGCCLKPDGSPGPCAGDPSKCADCGPPPPASINDYLLLFFTIAIFYGIWILHKRNPKKTV